jgi:DNA-binding transcriptional MocR family regulator
MMAGRSGPALSRSTSVFEHEHCHECRPAPGVLAACGAFLAEARGIVERWIKAHTGALHWLPPEAGAFCCMQLDPGIFGPRDIERCHAHLARERALVARGPWFGDSAHVFRLGPRL